MFQVLQQKYMKKTYQNMTFQQIRKLTRPAVQNSFPQRVFDTHAHTVFW